MFQIKSAGRKEPTKKDMFQSVIILISLTLYFGFLAAREYYWHWQIEKYGVEIEANFVNYYVRHKPLEPKRYFSQFAFQTLLGQKVISEEVELSVIDKENFHHQRPTLIRYLPSNPIKVAPVIKAPLTFFSFLPEFMLLIMAGGTAYSFWQWREMD